MTRFGYARVSSSGQSLDIQIEDLNKHACEMIRTEKVSGTSTENRPELRLLLEFMRPGDELFVTRIDRLARSTLDLCNIVKHLEKIGCTLHCTQQPIETATPFGRMVVQLLGVIAEFENALRRERQMAGVQAARAAGKYKGRPKSYNTNTIRDASDKHPDWGATKIARAVGCSADTVYRAWKEIENAPPV